jgi:hypothetical protein
MPINHACLQSFLENLCCANNGELGFNLNDYFWVAK